MNEHTQYPPGSQDAKASAECNQVVNLLVQGGNPKSNLFALCLIHNADQNTHFAIKAVDTMTKQEVLKEITDTLEEMRKELNESI